MRRRLRIKAATLLTSTLGLVVPAQLQADSPNVPAARQVTSHPQSLAPAPQAPLITDIALDTDGRLNGQAIDSAGLPAAGAAIVVAQQGREVARTTTDAAGHFTVNHLTGGVYEIHCAGGGGLTRLWAPHTAPPAARSLLTVHSGEPIVRGQHTFGPYDGSWLKGPGPWLIAAAAIVAVPTALALGLKPRSAAS